VVHSAKHREYQLVAKSTVPCFFKLLLFSQCRFFPLWYAPELGGTMHFLEWGGTLKKISRRFAPEFVPPTSKPCRRLWKLY